MALESSTAAASFFNVVCNSPKIQPVNWYLNLPTLCEHQGLDQGEMLESNCKVCYFNSISEEWILMWGLYGVGLSYHSAYFPAIVVARFG